MKRCFKCGVDKPLEEFYRHPAMGDGHLGKCKACAKRDVSTHRQVKVEAVRAYDRDRSKLPHRIASAIRVVQRWRQQHPDRAAAQQVAERARRIAPPVCERCGQAVRLERHHPDYAQPLLIEWLCKPCHCVADKLRRERESA